MRTISELRNFSIDQVTHNVLDLSAKIEKFIVEQLHKSPNCTGVSLTLTPLYKTDVVVGIIQELQTAGFKVSTEKLPVFPDSDTEIHKLFISWDSTGKNETRYPHLYRVDRNKHIIYVVMLSEDISYAAYDPSWMGDESFLKVDSVFIPDMDIRKDDNVFIFDSNDSNKNERDAMSKMKELRASLNF